MAALIFRERLRVHLTGWMSALLAANVAHHWNPWLLPGRPPCSGSADSPNPKHNEAEKGASELRAPRQM